MTGTSALYYDGQSARAVPVRLVATGQHLEVHGDGIAITVPLAEVRTSSRLARIRRVLWLPNGAQVHTDDNDAIDALFPARGTDVVIDALERHSYVVAASLVLTVAAVVGFFAYGLPRLADRIAREIPFSVEAKIGEQALAMLDETAFDPSALPIEQQEQVNESFQSFVANLPDAERYTLEFRRLDEDAPNAFALPGGTIIVTDGLVESMLDPNAFYAVIAHELGHHAKHHVMRSVLQSSAIVVLVTMVTGDVSAATGVVLAVPTFLLNNHYSREFEREADDFAFATLRSRDISPEWFAYALSTIEGYYDVPVADAEGTSGYLSTHPSSTQRHAAAREAAAGFDALEVLVARGMAASLSGDTTLVSGALVGCWGGERESAPNQISRWKVRLEGDGSLAGRFSVEDGTGNSLANTSNTGRWAMSREVMTIRMLTATNDTGGGSTMAVDQLHSYYVDTLTDELLAYESLHDESYFESHRIDCSELDHH